MPATVTLSTLNLTAPASASARQVLVSSTSGLIPGVRLFCEGELMSVVSLGVGSQVNVLRGVDATAAAAHSSGASCWIGRADQFFRSNPIGRPSDAVLVSPHINVANGSVWFAQGDASGARWWQQQQTSRVVGALGVRTESTDISSST